MLASDAHGGFGGISQYNRDVLEALSGFDEVAETVVLQRIVNDASFSAPPRIRYDLKSTGGRLSFVWRCLVQALAGGRFDFVYCAHINLLSVATLIGRVRHIPVVLAIYGIDAWHRPAGWPNGPKKCAPSLVISISKITLDRFQAWAGYCAARTAILPNAIRHEDYGIGQKNPELSERFGLSGKKVVMTFGRMSAEERYKGFDEIIDLLPNLRQAQPNIVYVASGDGSDRLRLEAKARKLHVDDIVVFPGRIPEDMKADYYRLADAYVMPSSGEGFGFVIIEALACGVPIVASSADGTREAVRDGELGILVDPKDPHSIEAGILRALKQPKTLQKGVNYFSFENFADRLGAALSPLIHRCSGRH